MVRVQEARSSSQRAHVAVYAGWRPGGGCSSRDDDEYQHEADGTAAREFVGADDRYRSSVRQEGQSLSGGRSPCPPAVGWRPANPAPMIQWCRLNLAVVLVAAFVLVTAACGPPADDAAKRRVRLIAEDAIETMMPPGGRLLSESETAGHEPNIGGPGEPTVTRTYSFVGDTRSTAISIVEQVRRAGWRVFPHCDAVDGAFILTGGKDMEGFRGSFQAQVWVRPASAGDPATNLPPRAAERLVSLAISTAYPEDDVATTRAAAPQTPSLEGALPDCL